ncbi:hypothetical protein RB600_009138 [Gaeumannomyces tritici]
MSSKMTEYPQPLVVPPRQLPHKQTFIILHDRGWWADKFGPALPETAVPTPSPSPRTLAPIFPHAKFVIPTAARTRTIHLRAQPHPPVVRPTTGSSTRPPPPSAKDLQVPGLRNTTAYLHSLIRAGGRRGPRRRRAQHGADGPQPGGAPRRSCRCCCGKGPALGAVVGMCGWLSFCARACGSSSTAAGRRQKERTICPSARTRTRRRSPLVWLWTG